MEQALISKDLESLESLILGKTKISANEIIKGWENDVNILSAELGKKVNVETKIDATLLLSKNIVTQMNIVLRHIYRNSLDHGIEFPEDRKSKGKDECSRSTHPNGQRSLTRE